MRVLFTSDWHLGKIVSNYSMLDEQIYILDKIESLVIDMKVDLILIAGDIYDRGVPPKEAIQVFDGFVSKMIKYKIKVMLISGNHDSYERLAFGGAIFKESGFYIGNKFDKTVDKITLQDDFGNLNFYLVPYISYQEVRNILEDDNITSFHKSYEKMLSTIRMDKNERNVLVHHSFVVSNVVRPETSDSEKTLSLGGADFVDSILFDGFDYVSIGHVHKAQQIGNKHFRYSGSILKYSFSEANHKKSVTIVNFMEKGNMNYQLVDLVPRKDLVIIKGHFSDIINDKVTINRYKDDYIKILLLDNIDIVDPFFRLKSIYPNLMEFAYENPREFSLENAIMTEDLASMMINAKSGDFSDVTLSLFKEFSKITANYSLTKDDEKIIKESAESAMIEVMSDEN